MNDVYESETATDRVGLGDRVFKGAGELADNNFWSPVESDSAHDDGLCPSRYATLHRREVVRYVGQELSHERFFRYGQRDAGFSCRAAGPLQFGIVLRSRRLPSQGNGVCVLGVRKGVGAQ